MSNKIPPITLSHEFCNYYTQLLKDGKEYILCLTLTIEFFENKLVEDSSKSGMYNFIDHSGCYICSDGKFNFYATKK